ELDPSQPYAEAEITLAVPSPRDDLSITLRTCSLEYAIFRPLFGRRVPLRLERPLRLPVMRIEGYYAPSAEDAAEFLERLGNAVLFQLDLKTNVPMFLSRPAPAVTRPAAGRREITPLRPPEFEYDAEPMALYWYGRTAFQMPLLQFLAFYQVVEYYFPSFSEVKVRENIQRILKDPRFDYTNNGHLARLIAQVKPSRSGRGFGDERSQLQAAIQECVSVEDMRAFFEEDDRRKRFYDRSSGKKMPLVPVKVPVGAE